MERVVRERMTTQDVESITPQTLINIRPGRCCDQRVLRNLPAVAVYGPGQPALGTDPPPPPFGARPGWPQSVSVPASKCATCTSPLRPDVPDRDARGPEHRPDRRSMRPTPVSTRSVSLSRRTGQVKNGKVTGRSFTCTADEEENYVVAQANAPLDEDGTFVTRRRSCVVRPRPPASQTSARCSKQRSFFGATTEIWLRCRREKSRLHGRLAEADRVGRHGADPIPRARRRQPRPDGRQHAAPGRAVTAGRGAVHRDRHGKSCRPRCRRHGPG